MNSLVFSANSFTCSLTPFTNGFKPNFEVKNTNELIFKCCPLWLGELPVLVLCWMNLFYFHFIKPEYSYNQFEIINFFFQQSHIKRAITFLSLLNYMSYVLSCLMWLVPYVLLSLYVSHAICVSCLLVSLVPSVLRTLVSHMRGVLCVLLPHMSCFLRALEICPTWVRLIFLWFI